MYKTKVRQAVVFALVWALLFTSIAESNENPTFHYDAIQIFVDVSGSLADDEFKSALVNIGKVLAKLVFLTGARTVGVIPFAKGVDAWKSASASATFAERDSIERQKIESNEATSIFKQYLKDQELQAEDKYLLDMKKSESLYELMIEDSLLPVKEYLSNIEQHYSDCTSLNDLLERIYYDGAKTLNIVLTDGLETCSKKLQSVTNAEELASLSVVVLLVPSKKDQTCSDNFSIQLRGRQETWKSVIPTACVLPSYLAENNDLFLSKLQNSLER